MSVGLLHDPDQLLQCHHAGRVKVPGILQPQDDDLEIGIRTSSLNLRTEELSCPKEEVTLYMHDGYGGVLPLLALCLGQIPLLVELILHQRGWLAFLR